ncbi:DUF3644 domain-containing protein [Pontivivens nitratireducens]|uniref:DUF3644 domain-containing protein n=1 Tax=Pontivivens nitratireducens TaxID=2758038 RepID=UPI001639DC58|nr:DUF3644 domain-containing protein [Pontibrevibacter nitratireducens]
MADSGNNEKPKKNRRRGNTLENWEVAIVKSMIARGAPFTNDQDILAYFTRPTRSVNHRLISEIRGQAKHKSVKPASDEDLDAFLTTWPDIDHETGLSVRGDELLIKAREAMIAAVQTFNSAGLTFRAELFIVTSIIAWTYLLHAWFKRQGIDYRYQGQKTKEGADKFWELTHCLKQGKCPAKGGVAKNLKFLVEIRHEIEHRSTSRIDDALGAKLQSCALNFNDLLKREFGAQYGLEKRLPIALQFVSFGAEQRSALKKAAGLPKNLEAAIDAFENGLSEELMKDPAYRMSYGFVPITAKNPGAADTAVQIVTPGSPEAGEIEKIILKEVNKTRYPPGKVVEKVQAAGFPKFKIHQHTQLWQKLDAKKDGKGNGCIGDYGNWVWFDRWIDEVIAHCGAEGDRYR